MAEVIIAWKNYTVITKNAIRVQ